MKASILSVLLSVGLIFAGVAFPANQATAAADNKDTIEIYELNQHNLDYLKQQKAKAAADKQAQEDKAAEEKEKQQKIDKVQRKTGGKAKSWQVLNR